MNTLCIYHGNCADGFTSAWVVRRKFGDGNVDFHAGVYNNPPPDVTNKHVVLVDFSYKRKVMEEIIGKAASVLVLDHHKTAEEDLRDLPGAQVVFDVTRAGCRIVWDQFFPSENPPKLLLHVQDRDLWKFELEGTRDIQANLFSYAYDFAIWDDLMAADPLELIHDGKAIERKHFKDIRELLKVVTRGMVIGGHLVPIANLPYTLASDAGHILADGAPFGGCYWDTPDGRVFGLRSIKGGIDVAEVAKKYGGGGHANASGFRLSYEEAAKLEISSVKGK